MGTALLSFDSGPLDPRLSRSIWFLNALMTVHVNSAETNGQSALVEVHGKPGCEPPMHIHTREDEIFYVREGRLKIYRGADELILEAGEAGILPRNVPHTFKICSPQARWLITMTPGGFEDYFSCVGQPARAMTLPETPCPPDVEKMVRVGNSFGISFPRK
jgi:quercetin dioxygenase-like cupin family protein